MRFFISFLFLLAVSQTTRAQFAGWFTYDTTNSAIPSNLVTSVEVDNENSLWIGTFEGLAKFQDFFNWTIFTTSNSQLPDNRVTFIRKAPDQKIWLGTQGGLAILDGASFTVYNSANSPLTSNLITSIAFENSIGWITTDGGGFYRFDGSSWQTFNSASTGFNIDVCHDVSVDPLGNKWIGTLSSGLLKVSGNVVTAFTPQNSQIPFSFVRSVTVENDTTIWLGMGYTDNDSALVKFNGTFDFQVYSAQNTGGIAMKNIWDILLTIDGEKWVCTNDLNHGAISYNDTLFTDYNSFNSGLPFNRVYSAAKDTANVWFGTMRGLAVFNIDNAFLSVSETPQLLSAAPYPNPTTDFIHLVWNPQIHQAMVDIYTIDGKKVMTKRYDDIVEGRTEIEVDVLPSGFYFAVVQARGTESYFKFIKQ